MKSGASAVEINVLLTGLETDPKYHRHDEGLGKRRSFLLSLSAVFIACRHSRRQREFRGNDAFDQCIAAARSPRSPSSNAYSMACASQVVWLAVYVGEERMSLHRSSRPVDDDDLSNRHAV